MKLRNVWNYFEENPWMAGTIPSIPTSIYLLSKGDNEGSIILAVYGLSCVLLNWYDRRRREEFRKLYEGLPYPKYKIHS